MPIEAAARDATSTFQLGTMGWIAGGVLLLAVAGINEQHARTWIVGVTTALYGFPAFGAIALTGGNGPRVWSSSPIIYGMSIEVRAITATLGAEVSGVDMASVDDHTLGELKKAWLDHKVLVIRDQPISTEEHIAFGRLFGELEVHPFAPGRDDFPEIVKIESTSEHPLAASRWHSDVTFRHAPPMGSILRGVVVPPVGGDTCFADAGAAYDQLPDEWKERVDDLFAIHDFTQNFGKRLSDEERVAKQAEFPPARHPVIRTHPETGTRSIYTNRPFVSHIDGASADESKEIVDRLEREMMNPSVQCRIRWQVDTFVMWDNRAVQHCATNDFWPETRHVERVTIVGDKPR